jgi:NADPH:quinone reductase-like Zn-dependent oxidoreductase
MKNNSDAERQEVISQWTLPKTDGIRSLVLVPDANLEPPADDEVRVKLHSASLNHRDLVIVKVGICRHHHHNVGC